MLNIFKKETNLFVDNVRLCSVMQNNPCPITVFVFILDNFIDNYVSKTFCKCFAF